MFRWRKKIEYVHGQSECWLEKMFDYLQYPITKPVAARSLVQLKALIDVNLQRNDIKVVR